MRRKDREVTAFCDIYQFVSGCNTLRLGICGKDFPYVVPLSYGFECLDDTFTFYVHCAEKGKKSDLISDDPRVCVEIDNNYGYVMLEDGVTADYMSFIGYGTAEVCGYEEKLKALDLLMKNCGFEGFPDDKCNLISITRVYKITVKNYTCKRRFTAKEAAN